MVGADGGGVLRRGGRFGRLILSVEETADGAAGFSAIAIDPTHGSAGVRSREASISVCADCPRDSSTSPGPPRSIASNHCNSMRIELPNGVVIHVAGDLDGQRLGDVIIAAGQIPQLLPGATAHGLLQHEVSSC